MRICIIGAGAGGLSAGYYLQKRGYRHVTILEKTDRIGGLCRSFTFDRRGFDLGGNYVLPGYGCVRKIAREIGAELTTGPDRRTWDFTMNDGRGGFRSTLSSMLQHTTFLAFAYASLKYLWLRFRYRRAFARPGFGAVSQYPELSKPLSQFIRDNGLHPIRRLFAIPISIMGYGAPGEEGERDPEHPLYLEDIAAAYALNYLDIGTFLILMLVGSGLSNSWPKRFVDGYQRFWERIVWRLDVRLGVDVEEVRRGDRVTVTYRRRSPDGASERRTEEFDALMLACPLPAALGFLDADPNERELYSTIRYNRYDVTTWVASGMPDHIVDVIPLTAFGRPWALVKQWPDSDLCLAYTRVDDGISDEDVQRAIVESAEPLGATVHYFHDHQRWHYFPHVHPEQMKDGFYDRLEDLQGKRRTWLLGGTMGFELVERAVEYSEACVDRFFPPVAK